MQTPNTYIEIFMLDEDSEDRITGCMRVEDFEAIKKLATTTPVTISRAAHRIGMIFIPVDGGFETTGDEVTINIDERGRLELSAMHGQTKYVGMGMEIGDGCDNSGVHYGPKRYHSELIALSEYSEYKTQWDEFVSVLRNHCA